MARDHGRILVRIWSDPDFRNMSGDAQRFYLLALTQPGMSYAGVVPYTVGRWALLAKDGDVRRLRRAAAETQAHRFVVIDERTEELFVRSYLRNDRILRQPNVAIAACRAVDEIVSPMIRAAWLVELHRLIADDAYVAELVGNPNAANRATEAVLARYAEPLPEGFPEGFREGLYEGLPEEFWKPFGKPLGEGLAEPLPAGLG